MSFPWYEKIEQSGDLQQGDFIPECPIIIPPSKIGLDEEADIEVKLIDSIILSQSCDLVNNKLQIVLVCPYFPLAEFITILKEQENFGSGQVKKHVDNMRKGFLPGYHLLNRSEEVGFNDYFVVDFRNVYGIQIDSLKQKAFNLSERMRLLPPYREHLSQAFARYFMRVGLPQDIILEGYI